MSTHRHANPDGSLGGWVIDKVLVADTAHVDKDATVEAFSVIRGGVYIGPAAYIGKGVIINRLARVHKGVWIQEGAVVGTGAVIDDWSRVAVGAVVPCPGFISMLTRGVR